MTRLDIRKMNKEYIDTAQFSQYDVRQTSPHISFNMIQDVLHNQDLTKIKLLLRANELPVDHKDRGQLWINLSRGNADSLPVATDETFQMYAAKFTSVAPETILPINDMTDEMRTHHMLSDEGVKACHRVLYVISETHPQIQQFSPLLYAFTSILLHYMSEQHCFQCIDTLLNRKDVNYFLAPTELSLNAACFVLRDLAFRYMKSAAVFVERTTPDGNLASFSTDWIFWIFKHLPFHFLVRIIDCYLVEGYKVLFRVALVLIKLFHKVSSQKSSFMDPSKPDSGIKMMCSEIDNYTTCDRLLKEAFSIRGFSKKEIDSLFTKTEQAIRGGGLTYVPSHRSSNSNTAQITRPNRQNNVSEKRKRLIGMNSKKSFKLDKEVHTQLILNDIESDILDKLQMNIVWSWLPPAESVKDPELVFTTNEHGYSLKTFYEKVEYAGPVLVIIRTMNDEVFGAYCSTDWVERHKYFDTGAQISYFGNGQSFVFTICPEVVYHWVGKEQPVTPQTASMFQAGDKSMLMVGGGNGCALQVDKDLDHGSTSSCETFNNLPLVDSGEFRIQCLEVFAFAP